VGGVKRGGSSAVVTSGDPGNPNFLDVRHQCGPEYTSSLEVEMWAIWVALDCHDNEAVAASVLICSDNHWALNALKESGHSSHSVLALLRARLGASRAVYASNGSPLIAAFSETRGQMRRPGRLPVLALMTICKGGGYPLRWLRA
jgi:hypothetical protein